MRAKLIAGLGAILPGLLCLLANRNLSLATGSAPPATHVGTVESDPGVVSIVRRSLASPEADTRAAALAWIARDPRAEDDSLIPAIFGALRDRNGQVQHDSLRNLGWISKRHQNDATGRQALEAVIGAFTQNSDRAARLVVVDLLRGGAASGAYSVETAGSANHPLLTNPQIQSLIASFLNDADSALRPQLLQVVSESAALQAVPAIVQGVGACLEDNDLTVRSNAVDLLAATYQRGGATRREEAHTLLLTALEEGDANVQLRASKALGLPIPPRKAPAGVLSLTGEKISTANVPFDFNYFTAFVQPLFVKKYGNAACVDCHTPQSNTSGKFRILAPAGDGRYTVDQSRVNFVSVLAVIDRQDPDHSKLLLKPLDPNTREGKVRGLTHDGGAFWANEYDPDFEIVKGWLDGAKLETPPEKQLSFAYFVQHVEPIFSTPGPDGIACINCHSTHAILHLLSPETREGTFSVEQLVNNYQSAHRVVDEGAPTNSFIVRKPTSPREGEVGGISHAGGVRWPDQKESWQYKALISWISMENLAPASASALAKR
jgi:hypothetical protein